VVLSGVSITGLERLMIDYTCIGTERNLDDCSNSSLGMCNNQAAAVSCQGIRFRCVHYQVVCDLTRTHTQIYAGVGT
jgi:hypothetical protein